MSFFNKKSWLNKEKEDLKRFDEEIYGKDIELEVNIKDIFTLTLFLGSISGAINNNQLAGVQMEYVSNMQKIARLANLIPRGSLLQKLSKITIRYRWARAPCLMTLMMNMEI